MKHAGRKLGILCLSLIGTLLLSSCTYTLQEAPQSPSSTPEQGDEEEAAEPEAHEILRDQLIALYNLNHAAQKQLPCNPATSSVWKQQPKEVPFGLRQKYKFPSLPRISVWTPVPSRSTWAAASSLPTVVTP